MKKLLFSLALLLTSAIAMAQSIFSDRDFKYLVVSEPNKTVEIVESLMPLTATSINIPSTVTYNGETYKVTTIRKGTFPKNNFRITSITVGDYVESLPEACFRGYNNASIKLGERIKTLGDSVFFGCSGTEEIILPESLTELGAYAFYGCRRIKSVTVPAGVTVIKTYTFYNTDSLESITLKGQITSIQERGIQESSLLSISIHSIIPPTIFAKGQIWRDSFHPDIYETAYVHIPVDTEEDYRNSNWNVFKNLIPDIASKQCTAPTIELKDGKFIFASETPDVEFKSTIETITENNGNFNGNEVEFKPAGIKVTVYATKEGYINSQVVEKTFPLDLASVAADVNKDTKVNSTDVVAVYNYILSGK